MSIEPRMLELLADHALDLLEPEAARRLEAELAASPELRAEAEALRGTLYAIPAGLEPQPPAPGAWEALLARTRETGTAPVRPAPVGPAPAAARRPTPPRRRPLALALALSLLLLALSLGWGTVQYRTAALHLHEQAVVAYWMRVPGMKVVPLQAVDGAPGVVHPGVVCLLPDGRAMVLQPHPAPADGDYVLYGLTGDSAGGGERVPLGQTRGTLIEFHADGLQAVELALPGPAGGVVARAALP